MTTQSSQRAQPNKPIRFMGKGTSLQFEPRRGPERFFPKRLFPNGRPIEPVSIWRIYATSAGRKRAMTYFQKAGYKYFVTWHDTKGFGLQASFRAMWQDDNSPVSIQ